MDCNVSREWERLEISSRKLRDTNGTFHAKMGTIKDRNGMDLTETDSGFREQTSGYQGGKSMDEEQDRCRKLRGTN